MSSLNAALTYKLQKMERTLSSLMEENAMLKMIINEEGMMPQLVAQTPPGGPNFPSQFPPSTSPSLPTPAPIAPKPTAPSPKPRIMTSPTPTVGGVNNQPYDGEYLGRLLAAGDMRAVQAYIAQYAPQQTGVQTAAPTVSPTATQMRMPLSQTGMQSPTLTNPTATQMRQFRR